MPAEFSSANFDSTDQGDVSLLPATTTQSYYDDVSIQILHIKHHLAECDGFEVDHCLIVRRSTSEDWGLFYDKIIGFDYKWGYDYKIVVRHEHVESGVADRSTQQYTLVQVLSVSKNNTEQGFQYVSRKSGERIEEISLDRFSMLGMKEFVCETDQCSSMRSLITQNHSAVFYLQHGANPTDPLVLESIQCSDSESAFDFSCGPGKWLE